MKEIIEWLGLNKEKFDRGQFIRLYLIAFALVFVAGFLNGVANGASSSEFPPMWVMLISLVLMIAAIYLALSATIRRLRDIGWNHWFAAIMLVPYVNLVFFVVLCFKK